ncbi:MAG: putative DNA binding domain-containing protein [Anaerolineales bacterium]|nr:putative DNA binding domain-containing protein [Anaerolineales bacterium]
MVQRKKITQRQWYRMDLHLHSPASADFKQTGVTYLDLLKKAEERNLDVIAFTDHNTAAGYARLLEEVESLEMLERLKRLRDDERKQLDEHRRLREKILILPGFEITATLGFHVLALFPPETTVRELDHLLLSLRVPADKLDLGSGEVGATSDVLTIYRTVHEAGGLVIAAHANSSHGVAMPGFDFGGQTRIAYTQDSNLHALEVTDLDSKSRRRTAMFFSGTKPEYPRRMHCIQGSDAHKLDFDPRFKNEMGIGDRATEILLDDVSFDAIKAVFAANDFSRTRPYRPMAAEPFDPLREAREHGDTLIQAFHEHLSEKRGVARQILQDIVALANTNGGTVYIGASAEARKPVVGVDRPEQAMTDLRAAIAKGILPPLEVQIETQKSQGKNVLQVIVPRGSDVPYVLEESYIYIRSENETGLAVRDEIMQLVRDALAIEFAATGAPAPKTVRAETAPATPAESKIETPALATTVTPPRTGVEIVAAEQRKGVWYYSVRDLRNMRVVQNVTLKSARRLWQYAIAEREKNPFDPKKLTWEGGIVIAKTYKRASKVRYDLAQRVGEQTLVYYGVTEDGVHGPWRNLIEGEPIAEEEIPEVAEPETRAESTTEDAETAGFVQEAQAEETETPDEIAQPLIIEEEIPLPGEPEVRDETAVAWFEQVGEAEDAPAIAEEQAAPLPDEPPSVEESPAPELPPAPPVETPPTAIVPTPPAPLVPKTRAQEWREQLERAMEEARKAREGAPKPEDRSKPESGS